jgi:hypothetical protein
MDEVAAIAETTEALLLEGVTALGLVGPVVVHIDLELLRTMGELASSPVGAVTALHEVLAERTLGLGTTLLKSGEIPRIWQAFDMQIAVVAVG